MMRYARRHDEAGQALMLALVFVSVMGILSAAVLNHVGVGLRAATQLDGLRRSVYSANAALDTAVNSVRSSTQGLPGNCPGVMNINNAVSGGAPNNVNIWVASQCVDPISANADRDVLLTACTVSTTPCPSGNVAARAEVYYLDLPSRGFAAIIKDWSGVK
jgi:hypothetical protein